MATLVWNVDANRFEMISTYAERMIPKQAGFRWDRGAKRWWTDQEHKAAKVASLASGLAKQMLAEHVEKAERTLEESRAVDANIEIPAPVGLAYRGFQKAGINFAAQRRGTLIGDEMGLGKTIQALGLVNLDPSIQRVLVIVPASLKLNWQREAKKWLTRGQVIAVAASKYAFPTQADVVIINYDILKKFENELNAREWDLVVMDECHYIKNPKAQRSQRAMKIPARKRLMLTGTPIVNRPIELWNLLKLLDPARWTNFMAFAKRYCDAKHNGWGWDFSGASNLDELHNILRSTVMVRRLKEQVLAELPPKQRQVVEIPTNGSTKIVNAQLESYERIEQLKAELAEAMIEAELTDDREGFTRVVRQISNDIEIEFENMSAARKAVAVAKAKMLKDYLSDLLEAGQKIVVFAHHHEVIDQCMDIFGDAAVKLDGRMTAEAKQESVDRFQNDENVKIFVGSIMAAGVGITLTAASQVVFLELDWVPGNMQQAEDRCHRIGQTQSVNIQYLVFENSVDSKMAHTLVTKMAVIHEALDQTPEATLADTLGNMTGLDFARVQQEAEKIEKQWQERQEKIAREAKELGMNSKRVEAIHEGLRFLAGRCDYAQKQDGMGFNGRDALFGHRLAELPTLTPRQAVVGLKMVTLYQGQLKRAGLTDLLEMAGVKMKEVK